MSRKVAFLCTGKHEKEKDVEESIVAFQKSTCHTYLKSLKKLNGISGVYATNVKY
jgi:hypothetical protein